MNTINLLNKRDFPLTTNVLKFMQTAYSNLEKFAAGFAGDNFILSGCVVTGSAVSSGWVVINGRLMPFSSGSVQTYVKVVTTQTIVTVDTGTRTETTYNAEFGTGTSQIAWATLNANRPYNLLEQIKAVESSLGDLISALQNAIDVIEERIETLEEVVETIVPIDKWDMTVSDQVQIPHTFDLSKIRGLDVCIIDDSGVIHSSQYFLPTRVLQLLINPSNIIVYTYGSGFSGFSSTANNRGFITVKHLA